MDHNRKVGVRTGFHGPLAEACGKILAMAELDSQPKPIQSLYSWYVEERLFVNRRYQRKLVWTAHEKQKLIESVLRKFPVPAILLAERDGGKYEVIDGLQRLHTLISFIEGAFPTLEDRYFDISQFPTARDRLGDDMAASSKGAEVLSGREVGAFLDYVMAVTVMRGATEDEVDDVFGRINTYGHRLSDQERRQAGTQNSFSQLVRELACQIRGDASSTVLNLQQMPAISIDLPMSKHGYEVAAEGVFWVQQGILRSTDLRDSMDEQCIADIAASVIGGDVLERSKEALDAIYEGDTPENRRIEDALASYGSEAFSDEFKYCVDEIRKICEADGSAKLRTILFRKSSTNAFAAAFAVLFIAIHEAIVTDEKRISDYKGVKNALTGLYDRLDTGRKSTASVERRKNIDSIKGLLSRYLVAANKREIYGAHSTVDIDNALRRSEIELPHYELKQGLLMLSDPPKIDTAMFNKVVKTVCAIANNGPDNSGTLLIGVTDDEPDANRVKAIYGVQPKKIGTRYVVGVKREADFLGETTEAYFSRWKDAIRNSKLSEPLKGDVLANMDYNSYYGMGVIVLRIPPQSKLSYLDDVPYRRDGDSTVEVTSFRDAEGLSSRFTERRGGSSRL